MPAYKAKPPPTKNVQAPIDCNQTNSRRWAIIAGNTAAIAIRKASLPVISRRSRDLAVMGLTRPSSATAGGIEFSYKVKCQSHLKRKTSERPAVGCSVWLGLRSFRNHPDRLQPSLHQLRPSG